LICRFAVGPAKQPLESHAQPHLPAVTSFRSGWGDGSFTPDPHTTRCRILSSHAALDQPGSVPREGKPFASSWDRPKAIPADRGGRSNRVIMGLVPVHASDEITWKSRFNRYFKILQNTSKRVLHGKTRCFYRYFKILQNTSKYFKVLQNIFSSPSAARQYPSNPHAGIYSRSAGPPGQQDFRSCLSVCRALLSSSFLALHMCVQGAVLSLVRVSRPCSVLHF